VKTDCVLTGTNPPQFLSIEQLAERARRCDYCARRLRTDLRLTQRTFIRRFRAAFGCDPRMWLSQQRMRDAATLLAQGFTTKEVASKLAFRHPPSFFRKFRRLFGATPTEFLEERAVRLEPPTVLPVYPLSQTAIFLSQTATSRGLPLERAI
jgi:AraC-like DNA-binding protein